MRVAYVCCDPGVPVFGSKGCSIHVQEVVREFLRRDCQVDLFAMRTGGASPADLAVVPYRSIVLPKSQSVAEREQSVIAANVQLLEFLHVHGPFDLVYERYSLFVCAGMNYARKVAVPGILEVNSPLIREQGQYRRLEDHESAELLTRRAMSTASAIVAVSEAVADYARSYRGSSSAVHVVPNGVNVERFAGYPVIRDQRPRKELTIGFVGTLKQWHGVADLIEAFRQVASEKRDVRLLIIGDGPERSRLERQVDRLPDGLSRNVEFTGAVAAEEIPSLLAKMDIAVAPYGVSSNFYFSPLKIYEYMAAGLPTVVSRVGEMPDLIRDLETGLLYEPSNVLQLADALLTLMEQPELRSRLGKAARAQVSESSTWEAVVSQVLAIAGKLGGSPSPIPAPHFRQTDNAALSRLATKR